MNHGHLVHMAMMKKLKIGVGPDDEEGWIHFNGDKAQGLLDLGVLDNRMGQQLYSMARGHFMLPRKDAEYEEYDAVTDEMVTRVYEHEQSLLARAAVGVPGQTLLGRSRFRGGHVRLHW